MLRWIRYYKTTRPALRIVIMRLQRSTEQLMISVRYKWKILSHKSECIFMINYLLYLCYHSSVSGALTMSVSPDRARVAPSRPRITECSQVSSARTFTRAVNERSQCLIVPSRAFSLLKTPNSTSTLKNIL